MTYLIKKIEKCVGKTLHVSLLIVLSFYNCYRTSFIEVYTTLK